jgi:hypothetical protein
MTLRPVQAAALFEAWQNGGLLGHIRTSGGKTLISGLAPTIMNAKRPLLILPAKLVGKTIREFGEYRTHFKIPHNIKIVSYTKLSQPQREGNAIDPARFLWDFKPDLIIADEAHKLRHFMRAACAARVYRYFQEFPHCRLIALSATLTKGSILDYAHLAHLALRCRSPLPSDAQTLAEWSSILDAKVDLGTDPTSLIPYLGPVKNVHEARQAYQRRLESAPGVIISRDSFDGVPLRINVRRLQVPEKIEPLLDTLYTYWEAPDGWRFADCRFEVWHCARRLGLGFDYQIDPRPPLDWFYARRRWGSACRSTIEDSNVYDSQYQVASACARGDLGGEVLDAWLEWKEIEPTFTPRTKTVWHDYTILKEVVMWGYRNPRNSMIWVEHVAFGDMLHEVTGWSYYRNNGLDANGRYIENHDLSEPAIVSIESNQEGRNLQTQAHRNWAGFHKLLIPCPLNQGDVTEQLLSRPHRDGQIYPVDCEIWIVVRENESSLDNARREANYIRQTTGQEQKLLIAEWSRC